MKLIRCTLFWLASLAPLTLPAQSYPSGFYQILVAVGITNPTVMAHAPDGRIFVAQQGGALRVFKNGSLLAAPFVQLTVNASGERGLIGIALDPDFATNNYIYLYYTVPSPLHNRVSRFTANGDVATVNSEVIVLDLDPLSSASNHNGGALAFGPDGKLYVAVGENANTAHAQNLDTYHGKILRINKDGSVPAGNPYPTGTEQRRRVWAHGLRNPYTIAFHPVSGRFLVNDVGQTSWEEINDATTGGKNFGWPTTEGMFNPATYPAFTNPVYVYGRGTADGVGCALTGGTFFNPSSSNYPNTYLGKYFIVDFCSNWINVIDLSSTPGVRSSFATSIAGSPVSITTGVDGNLYYLSRSNNALYQIVFPIVTGIETDSESNVGIFPVPVTGDWFIAKFVADYPQKVHIQLTDVLSRSVKDWQIDVQSGEIELTLSAEGVPNGLAVAVISLNGKSICKRLVTARQDP